MYGLKAVPFRDASLSATCGSSAGASICKMAVWYRLLAAMLAVAQGPYPANTLHPPPAWFVDVAAQAGVQMNNVNGESNTKKYIIETTGSGVAVLDYDRDGWPDTASPPFLEAICVHGFGRRCT